MNKKFFTLAAGLLLTSAFSANAVDKVSLANSKKGEFVEIKLGSTGSKLLQIEDNNELKSAAFVTVTDGDKLKDAFDQQWQIACLKYDDNSGTPIYQFID